MKKHVLVVSPHLDDAVYSAGQFLAGRPGAVVVTIFAGTPNPPQKKSWDVSKCGFADSQQAMLARKAEDGSALAVLNATPVHLDFLDNQYGRGGVDLRALANAILEQAKRHRPEFVVGPLGLRHPDHVRVRKAVLAAELDVPLWLYGDLPYRIRKSSWLRAALDEISRHGYTLEPDDIGTGPPELKREAAERYESQTKLFDIDNTIMVPELFWRVTRQ
ncbi:PIG-L family deacetylase [Mycobacterium heidelbergense]|uniref:PIG-L family deacetylase n=1 Tax=Mycobacterium heidelbergense TaxID=53376 RepID=UPI001E49F3E3|nr:PIG-L family deacetylase [Mycobacterium heidelbergense]